MAGEKLLPTIVYVCAFVGFAGILLTQVQPIFQMGSTANTAPPSTLEPPTARDMYTTLSSSEWTPTSKAVNASMIRNDFTLTTSKSFTFVRTTKLVHDIDVYIVRHNNIPGKLPYGADAIVLVQDSGWWNLDHKIRVIKYADVVARWSIGTNLSETDISMDRSIAVFVYQNGTTNFPASLYANNFTIAIRLVSNLSDMSGNPLTMISQMITMQIPNVGFEINLMVAVPVDFAIAFCVLVIIGRFIPTIQGG